MPLTETFSLGMVKQSPAPQHHSPAALRKPPRLIQESCADASAPIANNAPTNPTSAIDRSVMVVPLASNAPHTSGFLEVRSPRSAISSAMRRGNFKRADAFAMWWSLLALRVGQSEEFVDGAIG